MPTEGRSPKGWRGRLAGAAKVARGTFAGLPRVLALVWGASRLLTVVYAVATVLSGVLPASQAYVTKLVIDAVVHAISIHTSHAPDRATLVIPLLWTAFRSPIVTATTVVVALVGIQFLLLAMNALLQALSQASQQLLGERVGIHVQTLIMEHAATLDLAFFEDAKSYGLLQQAQQEARLLVLDEPSAALDAQAEHDLFQRLRTLAAGRTTIFISHRFSTVRQADRILVLEEGRLIEQGTHEALMALGGRYAHLFLLQAAAYVGDGVEAGGVAAP